MRGAFAQVWLALNKDARTDRSSDEGSIRLRFRAKTYLSARYPRKLLAVSVNGEQLAEFSLESWESTEREFEIPANVAARQGPMRVQFTISPVSSPLEDGVSRDPRQLGIQLQEITMDAIAAVR
jgi:hypothetical protein